LALGNVNRTHNLIRILATRLLQSHKQPIPEEEIKKIVGYLTEKLYSHQYLIGRKEAKDDLGIQTITYADVDLAKLMTQLFEEYEKEMQFGKVWNAEIEIGENQAFNKKDYKIAFIESAKQSNYFDFVLEFKKGQINITQQTPQGPIQVPQQKVMWKVISQGWKL